MYHCFNIVTHTSNRKLSSAERAELLPILTAIAAPAAVVVSLSEACFETADQ